MSDNKRKYHYYITYSFTISKHSVGTGSTHFLTDDKIETFN